MTLIEPDPHPGRCKNTRQHMGPFAQVTILRCLDYEGTPHVCEFPKPPEAVQGDWGTYSIPKPQPKRWVKPEEA